MPNLTENSHNPDYLSTLNPERQEKPILFKLDKEYPSVENVGKDSCVAKIVQESFSSLISEFTAFNQYSYDYILATSQNKEVANAFFEVALIERLHLELLGNLIVELGAIPYFKGDWKNKFWQGNFVKYNTNLRTMLLCAISDEKKAIKQYEESIEKIKEIKIVNLLKRIILDEKLHIEIFKTQLKSLE